MPVDIRTLLTVAALSSTALALALAVSIRHHNLPSVGAGLRIWALSIAIQALGWLLSGFRGAFPDAVTIVGGNVCVTLGFAECVRALRAFGGRAMLKWVYAPVVGVLAASIVFTYVVSRRDLRMLTNSALLAILMLAMCVEVLRLEPDWRSRPRSQWVVLATYGLGALFLLGRVAWLVIERSAETVAPMTVIILYASAALGPVVGTLGFALMCTDRLDRELAHLATVDPLTGAFNRRSLATFAEREILGPESYGLALIFQM